MTTTRRRDPQHRDVQQRDGKQRDGKQRDGKQRDGKQRDGKQRDGKQRARGDRVVRSQVEPRLQRRRERVADAQRRRRRRVWAVLAGVAAAVGLVVGAAYSPLLDVDRVRVEGASRLDATALVDASGLAVGDQMVQVDAGAARDALRRVPGIRSATVRREWPATVRIVVTEEQPAVELHAEGRHWVLATSGRLLSSDTFGVEGLVPLHVEGPVHDDAPSEDSVAEDRVADVVAEDVLAAAMVLHRMDGALRAQVGSARLAKGGVLHLELTDGAAVQFGPLEDVPAKLVALEATLAQVAPDCRKAVDVREPARVTVSRTCPGPPVTDGAEPADDGVDG